MSDVVTTGGLRLSLSELLALNDELAALVRAGVPLERTLGDMGNDLPGAIGRATTELARRVERGEPLPEALAAMPQAFPPVYRAAVEAGMRAGRLPLALENLARSVRRLTELRRVISLAAIYPFIVILVAYGLFVFLITSVLPNILKLFEGSQPPSVDLLVRLGQSVYVWGMIVPTLAVVVGAIWWYRTWHGNIPSVGIPIISRMLTDARLASFSEIMSLLVAHEVPLGDAMTLAADASADAALSQLARQVSDELQRGIPADELVKQTHAGFPPFLLWLIATGQRKQTLTSLLAHSADMYHRRAQRRADWLRYYLPGLLTVGIGGVVTLLYGLTLFVPLTDLLNHISRELH